jgi:hypothetical protein
VVDLRGLGVASVCCEVLGQAPEGSEELGVASEDWEVLGAVGPVVAELLTNLPAEFLGGRLEGCLLIRTAARGNQGQNKAFRFSRGINRIPPHWGSQFETRTEARR